MDREYIAWDSPILGRRMEMLWFGHAGKPMIWFPTSAGRFYQNEDFGLVGAVGDLVESGAIQICCVDSVDNESFYAKDRHPAERIRRHDQYDHYLANEVVPFARSKGADRRPDRDPGSVVRRLPRDQLRAPPSRALRQDGGVLGQVRHPLVPGRLLGRALLLPLPDRQRAEHGPEWAWKLSSMDICIVTGETDNILEGSKQLIGILSAKGIRHRGDIWAAPYGHDWPWWKVQIRSYVP